MTISTRTEDVMWMGETIARKHIGSCTECGTTWFEGSALDLAAVINAHTVERHR